MKEISEHVESILRNHADMKRQLKALEYELDALQKTLDPQLIEDRVLAHSGEERVTCSRPRDLTADIVIAHVDSQRNAKYHALKSVIFTMDAEARRLDYYLSLLPREESDVIRWFYFEGLNWADIRKRADVSKSTAQRRKRKGFKALTGYYTAIDNLPAFEKIVRHMKESGIGYGAINHSLDRDRCCGYDGIIGDECPNCGRRESEDGMPFSRIRRITGYLTGTVDRWNDAKKAELRDRVKHGM